MSADYASRFKAWRGAGLIFLIDGERLKVPEAKYLDSDVTRDASIESQLGCSLSVSEFTKIANGKDVEFQLGYFEHRFLPEHLALFREFLAKVRK